MIKRQEVVECWRKMAADFHKEPWFWVSGSRKQVQMFVGTRPGDPLADVVFAFDLPGLPEQFGTVPRAGGGDDSKDWARILNPAHPFLHAHWTHRATVRNLKSSCCLRVDTSDTLHNFCVIVPFRERVPANLEQPCHKRVFLRLL